MTRFDHHKIYLDYAASSPLRPECLDIIQKYGHLIGNASSIHAEGRKIRSLIEEAREVILRILQAKSYNLVFTSGATEANNLALHQAKHHCDGLIIGSCEHESIIQTLSQTHIKCDILNVDRQGNIDIDELLVCLKKYKRPFVSVMMVNNVTGVVEDVVAISKHVKDANGWFHCDIVQAIDKLDLNLDEISADSYSLSGHKIGAFSGIGCFIYKNNHAIKPMLYGGGQEKNLRAGSENIFGILSLKAALENSSLHLVDTRKLIIQLKNLGCDILGDKAKRVSSIISFTQPHWSALSQIIQLDLKSISVSAGSACSSGTSKPNRIALNMGYGELSSNVLRISFGWATQESDLDIFLDHWCGLYNDVLKAGHFIKEMS